MKYIGQRQHKPFHYSFSPKGKTFSSESNSHAFPSVIKQLRTKMLGEKNQQRFIIIS